MTDLWSLTIAFRGPNTSLRLNYNGEDRARAAYEAIKRPTQSGEEAARGIAETPWDADIEITDSYGTTATIDRTAVMTHWLTHKGSEAEGAKAEQVLVAHARASLERTLAADPMLKGMMPSQGGQRLNLNG